MKENNIFEKYIKENRNDIIVYYIVFLVVTIILFILYKFLLYYAIGYFFDQYFIIKDKYFDIFNKICYSVYR